MPGFLPRVSAATDHLRISLRNTRMTERLAARVNERAVFLRSEDFEGGDNPNAIIQRDDEGNILRRWQTAEERALANKLDRYQFIYEHGLGAQTETYVQERAEDPDRQTVQSTLDYLQVIATAYADIAVGGGVEVDVGAPFLNDLLNEDLELGSLVYDWVVETSVFGFLGVQTVVDNDLGTVSMVRVLPQNLRVVWDSKHGNEIQYISKMLVLPIKDIRDYEAAERYVAAHAPKLPGGQSKLKLECWVLEERHFSGFVEHYFWAATAGGEIIMGMPLDYYDPNMSPVQITGLPNIAITLFYADKKLSKFRGDWDSALQINERINDRLTRDNDILNRFSTPDLLMSANAATYDPSTGRVYHGRPRGGVMLVRPEDKMLPSYLQPQADISSSAEMRDALVEALAAITQTAAVLLVPKSGDTIDSGVAYKLKLTPTITKVARRAKAITRSIRELVLNLLSAMDYYAGTADDDRLLLKYAQNLLESHEVKDRDAGGAIREKFLKELKSGTAAVDMGDWAGVFLSPGAPLQNQPPGYLLQDPDEVVNQLAQEGEAEVKYFADQQQLEHLERSRFSVESLLGGRRIEVRLTPALPQDAAHATERLGGQQSMSLRRYLTTIDGMSDHEAEEEMELINNDRETSITADPFGGFGPGAPPIDPEDAENGDNDVNTEDDTEVQDDAPREDMGLRRRGNQSIQPAR